MGQVKELFDWARRRKILAAVFVTLTLVVGILIGSVVSGRVSAMKTFSFAGTNATPLAVPDPIPAASGRRAGYQQARRAAQPRQTSANRGGSSFKKQRYRITRGTRPRPVRRQRATPSACWSSAGCSPG